MTEWKTTTEMWVQCDGTTWVRWSSVVIVRVERRDQREDHEVVLILDTGQRVTYTVVDTQDQGVDTAGQLLGGLSGHYR